MASGYMPYSSEHNNFNPSGNGGFFPGTGENNEQTQKKKVNQTVRPVTVKQIKDMSIPVNDEPLVLDGLELGFITLVGVPVTIETSNTFRTINFTDSTGRIDIRVFTNENISNTGILEQLESISLNEYIRVLCSVKVFGNTRQLLASNIQPIFDHNEITAHYLECILTHVQLTRPRKPSHLVNNNQMFNQQTNLPQGGGTRGEETIRRALLSYMYDQIQRTPNGSNTGVSFTQIKSEMVKQGFLPGDLDLAKQWLDIEGHIYSGADDDKFITNSDKF